MIQIGQPAPDFTAQASDGQTVRLSQFRGRPLVLYFFPKAFTPGCTRETALFRDTYPEIRALGAEVLGISTDDLKTQCDFAAKMSVTFPILSDPDGSITRLYDVSWPLIRLARRVTFLVDAGGNVQGVFWHELQISKHQDDVLKALQRLTKSAPARA